MSLIAQKLLSRLLEGIFGVLLAGLALIAVIFLDLVWEVPGSPIYADWTDCVPSFFVLGVYALATGLHRRAKEPLSLAAIAMGIYLCLTAFWWMIGAVMPSVIYSGHPFAWAAGACSLAVYGFPLVWLIPPLVRRLNCKRA